MIDERIEEWLSARGEVDSYAKQLRIEINMIKRLIFTPAIFIQAGKNAEESKETNTGAVT